MGVGGGSERAPRLVKVEYSPAKASKHLALVGKGITFDTGGISLKPAAGMHAMKSDMSGAAAMFQTVAGVAELGLDLKVTAWLCLAENMPGGRSTRPGDVITIYGGKTVEVLNTDARAAWCWPTGWSPPVRRSRTRSLTSPRSPAPDARPGPAHRGGHGR